MSIQAKKLTNGFLFWFHTTFILFSLLSGLVLSWWVVIILVALHRLHVVIFDGCLISKLQNLTGGLPEGMNFLQLVVRKFFQREINLAQSQRLDYFITALAVVIAFAR